MSYLIAYQVGTQIVMDEVSGTHAILDNGTLEIRTYANGRVSKINRTYLVQHLIWWEERDD